RDLRRQPGAKFQRQAGLAFTAGGLDGDQPIFAEQLLNAVDVALAPDEVVETDRQAVGNRESSGRRDLGSGIVAVLVQAFCAEVAQEVNALIDQREIITSVR